MASFVENLRLGSIYNPFATPGPVDQTSNFAQNILPLIHGEQNNEDMRRIKFMNMMRAQQEQQQQQPGGQPAQAPRNTVFHEDITPLDKAKLDLEKQKLQQTNDIATGKLGFQHEKQDTDAAIRQQRANSYNRAMDIRQQIADSKMPEEDKIRLMNSLNMHLQELRGDQSLEQIGARNYGQSTLESQRQEGRSALETQKQTGRVDLKQTPSGTVLPTQQRQQYRANAERFINEHPGMANYIQFDQNDPTRFTVNVPENENPDILHGINSYIYGGPPTDTRLPASGAPASQPATQKPKILSITPAGGGGE